MIGDESIAVYSVGKEFEKNKHLLSGRNVVCFFDGALSERSTYRWGGEDMPLLSPKELSNVSFDKLIIFTDKYFKEIVSELRFRYQVDERKIVSWHMLENQKEIDVEYGFILMKVISQKMPRTILEIGEPFFAQNIVSKNLLKNCKVSLVSEQELSPLENSFYDNVYVNPDEVKQSAYDMVLIHNNLGIREELQSTLHIQYTYILQYFHYGDGIWDDKAEHFFFLNGFAQLFSPQDSELDARIFVVSHRDFWMAKEPLYQPLAVGEYRKEGWIAEKDGENIGEMNPYLNECTGLYWIWKNADARILGLCHYRRYFLNDEFSDVANRLSGEKIRELFLEKKADIVLPRITILSISVMENIIGSVGDDLAKHAFLTIKKEMQTHQPDYVRVWEEQLRGKRLIACNMIVARNEVFDAYCSWLFSFLPSALGHMDLSNYSKHQKRVVAFFSESMMLCWLTQQTYRVWFLPVLSLEKDCYPI